MESGRLRETVLHVAGPVTLDWGRGMRLTLCPAAMPSLAAGASRRGRKPSPATQALIAAMEADSGAPRSRYEYLAILRQAGHTGSDASAAMIVNREAKRVFGRSLGREPPSKNGHAARRVAPAALQLREKLAADKRTDGLREPSNYVRWLVDKANIGLKQARPIVYRELRRAHLRDD